MFFNMLRRIFHKELKVAPLGHMGWRTNCQEAGTALQCEEHSALPGQIGKPASCSGAMPTPALPRAHIVWVGRSDDKDPAR